MDDLLLKYKKVRRPESAHRKTQAPIAAKQILTEMGISTPYQWSLRFYKTLTDIGVAKKGIIIPCKKRQKIP